MGGDWIEGLLGWVGLGGGRTGRGLNTMSRDVV